MIHKRLAERIAERGIKQIYLSEQTGINPQRLTRILKSDKCYMKVDEYTAICDVIGLPYDFFKPTL